MEFVIDDSDGAKVAKFPFSISTDIDLDIVRAFRQAQSDMLLHYEVTNDGEKLTGISVEIGESKSLADLTASPIDGSTIINIFSSLHDLIVLCSSSGLPFMNVVLDESLIFQFDEDSSFKFIYLPLKINGGTAQSVQDFLLKLGKDIKANGWFAKYLIGRYIRYVEGQERINLLELSDMLKVLVETSEDDVLDPKDDFIVNGAVPDSADSLGTTVLAEMPSEAKLFSSRIKNDGNRDNRARQDSGTSVLNAVDFGDPEVIRQLSDGRVDSSSKESTRILGQAVQRPESGKKLKPQTKNTPTSFRLIRRRTGEIIEIDECDFTVGKSKYVSFQVRNTNTVSRCHAKFNPEGDICWIEDNESLNGTFLNERKLKAGERKKLSHGDVIRMSDELFDFETIVVE